MPWSRPPPVTVKPQAFGMLARMARTIWAALALRPMPSVCGRQLLTVCA